MSNLTPVQALILSKFKPEPGIILAPDVYEDSFTIKVTGRVKVGEAFERQESLSWKAVALDLLSHLSLAEARQVVKNAVETEETILTNNAQLEEKLVSHAKKFLGKNEQKGSVTGIAMVEVLDY